MAAKQQGLSSRFREGEVKRNGQGGPLRADGSPIPEAQAPGLVGARVSGWWFRALRQEPGGCFQQQGVKAGEEGRDVG